MNWRNSLKESFNNPFVKVGLLLGSIPLLVIVGLVFLSSTNDELNRCQKPEYLNFSYETTIATVKGKSYQLEIADTADKQRVGLMCRKELPETTGMLFVYGDKQFRTFWMKNTLIPLDIIFLTETGEIINYYENAQPLREDILYSSLEPTKYVLELKGGTISQLNLSENDQIVLNTIP